MLARTQPSFRAAAQACRFQSTVAAPSASHISRKSQNTSAPRPRTTSLKISPLHQSRSSIRYASTATAASPTASSTNAASGQLTWNDFFALRKTRRRLQLGSSIGTSVLGMVGGAQALAVSDMDWIVSQLPLDPFITLGLITFSAGGLGWLLGPIVGTGIFNAMNRKALGEMTRKEKAFYARIKQYRVDPSASSMANPVPDYYGEKIGSVAGYRQWLKDQRAFNKKRTTYLKL